MPSLSRRSPNFCLVRLFFRRPTPHVALSFGPDFALLSFLCMLSHESSPRPQGPIIFLLGGIPFPFKEGVLRVGLFPDWAEFEFPAGVSPAWAEGGFPQACIGEGVFPAGVFRARVLLSCTGWGRCTSPVSLSFDSDFDLLSSPCSSTFSGGLHFLSPSLKEHRMGTKPGLQIRRCSY